MSRGFFILQDKEVIPATRSQWMKFFCSDARIVAITKVGPAEVSTVFIGDGFNFFETIIFGGIHDQDYDWTKRYNTWDAATSGHAETVEKLLQEKSCGLCNGPMPKCGCPGEWLDDSHWLSADEYRDTSPEATRMRMAFAEWSLATFASNNEKEEK